MAKGRSGAALHQIRMILDAGSTAGSTDGQLLERFATGPREAAGAAFAALVDRHGPMVLRVCRGILGDPHDAQDAFQATFLVLVRKAPGLWVRDSLGPWLHQVAHRTARCARADAARRRGHERRAAGAGAVRDGAEGYPDGESERALHEEIARLPERFRRALVLCDLEGCPHEQAARHLGCPVGTVKSRLARGRGRLRDRLTRRGLAPALGPAFPALVPAPLKDSVLHAASGWAAPGGPAAAASVLSLTRRVLRMMLANKLKAAAVALLAVGAVVAGAWEAAGPASGAPSRQGPAPIPPARESPGRIYIAAHNGAVGPPGYSIISIAPKTGEESRVLDRCGARPRVSPDGRTTAFWRGDALWTRSVVGGDEPRRILDVEKSLNCPPVWSPDGRQVVVSYRKGEGKTWGYSTVRVNADGTGREDLKIPPKDHVLDWSADGRWLLTASERDRKGGIQLMVVRLDGTDERQITGDAYFARFSPDGRRICYTHMPNREAAGIWVQGIDGSDRRQVFPSGDSSVSSCWSPDGKSLAVVVSSKRVTPSLTDGGCVEIISLTGEVQVKFERLNGSLLDMPDWR